VGAGATALAVDPRTDRIYLARRNTNGIEIYDPLSFLPIDTIRVEGEVAHLAVDRQGNTLYLSLVRSRSVRMVRLVGKGSVWDADVAGEPSWVALMGDR
jgi:DNA-binding beta-propeller fold protein YncE